MDVEKCVDTLVDKGLWVVDPDNEVELKGVYDEILKWIDKIYDYEMKMTGTDAWFINELNKRRHKIEAISNRVISDYELGRKVMVMNGEL